MSIGNQKNEIKREIILDENGCPVLPEGWTFLTHGSSLDRWDSSLLGNDFVVGYVKLLIDILNINTFVRLRKIRKPETFLQKVFLEGGQIDLKTLLDSYNDTYQVLGEKLDIYGFREIMEVGAAKVEETGKYSLLERLCDDIKVRYIQGAKFVTTGIEPIAAFYIAKENEIKNLRMVLTGKLAGIAEETIKERLRETYV